MNTGHRVVPNLYRDSVALMRCAATVAGLPGVDDAAVVMATPANLELLLGSPLLPAAPDAGPSDVLVLVAAADDETLEAGLDRAVELLSERPVTGDLGPGPLAPRSIAAAVAADPQLNLALVSTAGTYAAAEARKALRLGLHTMLFSDNVDIADEVALKAEAAARGLLVMGPDCGTAIIQGLPLGFANVVAPGTVGVVAASGTGLQQVTCLVDRWGAGISQAIGTGGRDLSAEVGGATTLAGLQLLADDPDTEVIVVVSKPPAPAVAERLLTSAAGCGRPVVACLLGAAAEHRPGVTVVPTLDEAAAAAVAVVTGSLPARPDPVAAASPPAPGYLRGLFSGGTFSYETVILLSDLLGPVRSNTPVDPSLRLTDLDRVDGHTVVDLGDDRFTRGRPHPMIDYQLRVERLLDAAADPRTALILLDVVLGYGSHPDPASELVPVIEKARAEAGTRPLHVVASVCGTDGDPQGRTRQEEALAAAGVLLADSNAAAARLAAGLVAPRLVVEGSRP